MTPLVAPYHIDVLERISDNPMTFLIWADATRQQLIAQVSEHTPDEPRAFDIAQQIAHLPPVLAALRALVAADNCNYARDTMRYEKLFDAGRDALRGATGWPPTGHPDNSPIWTPAESAPALRDMLSLLTRTVNDTLRHGLTTGARESLSELATRAGALLNQTPSNE